MMMKIDDIHPESYHRLHYTSVVSDMQTLAKPLYPHGIDFFSWSAFSVDNGRTFYQALSKLNPSFISRGIDADYF